jgi:hypothetical protein
MHPVAANMQGLRPDASCVVGVWRLCAASSSLGQQRCAAGGINPLDGWVDVIAGKVLIDQL